MPDKNYIAFDSSFPYTFEYPDYAIIQPDEYAPDEPFWINVVFPQFKGKLHLSYKKVNNNLPKYIEDTRKMVMKHIPKASAIDNMLIKNNQKKVYGLTYDIKGLGAASPYQFFITDSTKNFVRGALYFHVIPNNDSLSSVIDFIKQDIEHIINTFDWTDN